MRSLRNWRMGLVVLLAAIGSAAIASAAGPIDLHDGGDLHEGISQTDPGTQLQSGSTYRASRFPVAVSIRAPDAFWGGVQHESGNYRFVQLAHQHRAGAPPLSGVGYITLESATVATPSAAKTLANLRATPHMSFGPTKAVTVAGLPGKMFDATVTGSDLSGTCPGGGACPKVVSFAPFLANGHCGFCGDAKFQPRETHDVKAALEGQLFRVIVLTAHRKVLVIYIESIFAAQAKFSPARLFPTFLPAAQRMLAAISFP